MIHEFESNVLTEKNLIKMDVNISELCLQSESERSL